MVLKHNLWTYLHPKKKEKMAKSLPSIKNNQIYGAWLCSKVWCFVILSHTKVFIWFWLVPFSLDIFHSEVCVCVISSRVSVYSCLSLHMLINLPFFFLPYHVYYITLACVYISNEISCFFCILAWQLWKKLIPNSWDTKFACNVLL